MSTKLCLFFFAGICAGVLHADIAPTQFIGSGVEGQGSTAVRMESADVRIVWGTPCTLSATFTMVNDTNVAEDLEVGFPMPKPAEDMAGLPNQAEDPLGITFNGRASDVTPPGAESARSNRGHGWRWYRCRHSFAPGKTVVEVQTVLRGSLVYATPFRESLFYCIESGGSWAGTIGEEVVTIEFPEPIVEGQIVFAAPAEYEIDGPRLRWRLRDVEPKGNEFDIAVTYIRPDVMRRITALRAEHAADPQSAATAIKLARHLLALGYAKSNSGFPPWRLSQDQYAAIERSIENRRARKTFTDHYRRESDGTYEEVDSEWTKQRRSLVQILADAGYRDEPSQEWCIREGEALLHDVLRREPGNADAWNVYLASYWRFSFAALGHWFGQTVVSKKQAALIKQAARHCPRDPWIQRWQDVQACTDSTDYETFLSEIHAQDFLKLEFDPVQYDYY